MAIVRNITTLIDVPHEPGASFVFRTLTWKQLRAARKAQVDQDREEGKAFGAEFIKAMRSGTAEEVQKVVDAFEYDPRQFDRGEVLKASVAAWSGPGYADLKPSEGIDELDEVT